MIAERIWCSRCGFEGPREIKGTPSTEKASNVFTPEGHDPYSGRLFFRCPKCKAFITVDPAEALGNAIMNGRPCPPEMKAAGQANLKFKWSLPILGGLYSGLALVMILIHTL